MRRYPLFSHRGHRGLRERILNRNEPLISLITRVKIVCRMVQLRCPCGFCNLLRLSLCCYQQVWGRRRRALPRDLRSAARSFIYLLEALMR
jgi:hypothetical protein